MPIIPNHPKKSGLPGDTGQGQYKMCTISAPQRPRTKLVPLLPGQHPPSSSLCPLLPLFCTHLFSVTVFFLLNEDNQRYHPWPAPCLGRQPEAKGQELNKASAKRVRQGQKSVLWVLSMKLSFRNYSKSSALFAAQTWLLYVLIRFAGVVLIPENIPGDSP